MQNSIQVAISSHLQANYLKETREPKPKPETVIHMNWNPYELSWDELELAIVRSRLDSSLDPSIPTAIYISIQPG